MMDYEVEKQYTTHIAAMGRESLAMTYKYELNVLSYIMDN
jgi:hypothetical protein